MQRNKNHYDKRYPHVRTGEGSCRFFAGGLQKTHEPTEKVTVGNLVEWRRKIELRSHHRQDDKYNIKQVERTDEYKYNPVRQFFIKKIAPERRAEKDEIVGKIAEIHQFAEPSPRHLFAKFEARLASEQRLVSFYEMMI